MAHRCASLCDEIGSRRGNVDVELRRECERARMREIKNQEAASRGRKSRRSLQRLFGVFKECPANHASQNLGGRAASARNLILLADENVGDRVGSANAVGDWLNLGVNGADGVSDLATLVENSVDDGETMLDSAGDVGLGFRDG